MIIDINIICDLPRLLLVIIKHLSCFLGTVWRPEAKRYSMDGNMMMTTAPTRKTIENHSSEMALSGFLPISFSFSEVNKKKRRNLVNGIDLIPPPRTIEANHHDAAKDETT